MVEQLSFHLMHHSNCANVQYQHVALSLQQKHTHEPRSLLQRRSLMLRLACFCGLQGGTKCNCPFRTNLFWDMPFERLKGLGWRISPCIFSFDSFLALLYYKAFVWNLEISMNFHMMNFIFYCFRNRIISPCSKHKRSKVDTYFYLFRNVSHFLT